MPSNDGNSGKHQWGPVREVEVSQIPSAKKGGIWHALYRELCLRLEQIPLRCALEISFDDYKTARSFQQAARQFFDRELPGADVKIKLRRCEGMGCYAYVYRRSGKEDTSVKQGQS
jgi:hypothetical protein